MPITRIAQGATVSYATAWRIIDNRPCKSQDQVEAVMGALPAPAERVQAPLP